MGKSLTSDNDYLEIIAEGTVEIDVSLGTDPDIIYPVAGHAYSGSYTITHNEGAPPLTKVWYEPFTDGGVTEYGVASSALNFCYVLSSDNEVKLIVSNDDASSVIVHYKIMRFGSEGFSFGQKYEKIFYKGSYSVDVPASVAGETVGYPGVVVYTHGEGEIVGYHLQWSVDQINWYPNGVIAPTTGFLWERAYGTVDPSGDIEVTFQHNKPYPQTIYVRYNLEYLI